MDLDSGAVDGPGSRLLAGRYELGPVIGIGSTAVVRRARDLRENLSVAVKQLNAGASAQDLFRHRRELAVLTRLRHPGLVTLHGGGTSDGCPFVVTDLVEGPTLADRIRTGPPLDPDTLRRLGHQLAAALAYVHGRGFIHRDVKPANVLLGNDQRARLADFGIARALDAAAATTAGWVVGTPAYLAPEQASGDPVGSAADVYALGLVLLEAATGRREFPGGAVESATARLHRTPDVPDALPGDLGDLLEAMTAIEPQRRPTARQVAVSLGPDRDARTASRTAAHARPPHPAVASWAVAALIGAAVAAGATAVSELQQPAISVTAVLPDGQP